MTASCPIVLGAGSSLTPCFEPVAVDVVIAAQFSGTARGAAVAVAAAAASAGPVFALSCVVVLAIPQMLWNKCLA